MLTSDTALNSEASAGGLNAPLADDRVYSEQFLADLLGIHIQTVRMSRRRDAAEGTIGMRVPPWTDVSEARIGYLGRSIKNWQAERTAGATPIAA